MEEVSVVYAPSIQRIEVLLNSLELFVGQGICPYAEDFPKLTSIDS